MASKIKEMTQTLDLDAGKKQDRVISSTGSSKSKLPDSEVIESLHEAINTLDSRAVKSILLQNRSLDLNQTHELSDTSMTLLHRAVGVESPEIVELLLQFKADPNSNACDGGLSPLHLSIHCENLEIFRLLLKAGGNPKLEYGDNKESCINLIRNMNDQVLAYQFLEAIDLDLEEQNPRVEILHLEKTDKIRISSPQVTSEVTTASSSTFQQNTFCRTTTEGISDQSTYPFTDETYSILNPKSPCLPVVNDSSTFGTDSEVSASCTSLTSESHCSRNSNCTCCSAVSPPPDLTEEELQAVRAVALSRGLPVLPSTIKVLSKFISKESNGSGMSMSPSISSSTNSYSMELDLALRDLDYVNQWQGLQVDFLQNLTTPKRSGRSFFNYVLLDPFILKRTNFSGNQLKTGLLQNSDKFNVFIKSIFYIGKGTANRPIQHLINAKSRFIIKKNIRPPDNSRLDKVVNIWDKGQGIIVLTLFNSSTDLEASANEAAMIDAIGLGCTHLTNIRKGSYLNTPALDWTQKAKNQFGTCLLHKAYLMFVVSGNTIKVFYPSDV